MGERAHSGCGRRADAGERDKLIVLDRDDATELFGDDIDGPLEGDGATVVAEPLPLLKHLGKRRGRERVDRRES